MSEEKRFDGIILPLMFRDVAGKGRCTGIGAVMGITQRELGFGPGEIVINYAFPTDERIKKSGLFWLDNCPASGPYSRNACYYWLLPHFSQIRDASRIAIRVRPTERGFPKYIGYDAIFWTEGKPASLGHQYGLGEDIISRTLSESATLGDVIEAWVREEYDLRFSKSVKEFNEIMDEVLGDIPTMILKSAENRVRVQARDATWFSKSTLVREVV
jgi:hypothetical protein